MMLRYEGFSAETDIVGRSVKAQMKYANKIDCGFSLVIGDNELENKQAVLKNMSTGEQTEITLPDGLITAIYDKTISNAMNDLTQTVDNLFKDN